MRKSGLLFSAFYFLFSNAACAPYDLYAPLKPAAVPSFEDDIKNSLDDLNPYPLYDSAIPIEEIWDNINFNTFAYLSFFNSVCPAANRVTTGNELKCDFSSATKFRQFIIQKNGNEIKIDFKKIGTTDFYLAAKWTIIAKTSGFSVARYERQLRDYSYTYRAINSEYKTEGAKQRITASGGIGYEYFGAYYFNTSDVYFDKCRAVPNGSIDITADDDVAEVYFLSGNCKNYVHVKINGTEDGYSYSRDWTLRDLFDSLKLLLE